MKAGTKTAELPTVITELRAPGLPRKTVMGLASVMGCTILVTVAYLVLDAGDAFRVVFWTAVLHQLVIGVPVARAMLRWRAANPGLRRAAGLAQEVVVPGVCGYGADVFGDLDLDELLTRASHDRFSSTFDKFSRTVSVLVAEAASVDLPRGRCEVFEVTASDPTAPARTSVTALAMNVRGHRVGCFFAAPFGVTGAYIFDLDRYDRGRSNAAVFRHVLRFLLKDPADAIPTQIPREVLIKVADVAFAYLGRDDELLGGADCLPTIDRLLKAEGTGAEVAAALARGQGSDHTRAYAIAAVGAAAAMVYASGATLDVGRPPPRPALSPVVCSSPLNGDLQQLEPDVAATLLAEMVGRHDLCVDDLPAITAAYFDWEFLQGGICEGDEYIIGEGLRNLSDEQRVVAFVCIEDEVLMRRLHHIFMTQPEVRMALYLVDSITGPCESFADFEPDDSYEVIAQRREAARVRYLERLEGRQHAVLRAFANGAHEVSHKAFSHKSATRCQPRPTRPTRAARTSRPRTRPQRRATASRAGPDDPPGDSEPARRGPRAPAGSRHIGEGTIVSQWGWTGCARGWAVVS